MSILDRGDAEIGSKPALEDLKECLARTRQRSELISSLSSALQRRLLIPGAQTADIIQTFIGTVKVLRLLDPQLPAAASLPAVSGPIKDYLRGRRDTIKCIVVGLTENNSIFEEQAAHLGRGASAKQNAAGAEEEDDSEEEVEGAGKYTGNHHRSSASNRRRNSIVRDVSVRLLVLAAPWMPQPVEFEGRTGASSGGGGGALSIEES